MRGKTSRKAVSARPPSAPSRSRASRVVAALLAAGLVAAGGYAVFARRPEHEAAPPPAPTRALPQALVARVHAQHPHDAGAFTQGLVWSQGRLFESTGLKGRSTLREVDLETGAVRRQIDDEARIFGEGLALVGQRLVQLSWRDERAFVWNAADFTPIEQQSYQGEGWGLCYDGQSLVMSDGSDELYFRNAKTFVLERSIAVTRAGQPQRRLNELECVMGKVYANIWQSDEIVRIDPASGAIDAVIDASGLLPERHHGEDVLNGIAYMPEQARFLVTGKLWPWLFEVTFEPADAQN